MLAGLVHDIGVFYLLYRFARHEELRQRPNSALHLAARWHDLIDLDAGRIATTLQAGGLVRLAISQYLQPGDALTLDVDGAAGRLAGLGVNIAVLWTLTSVFGVYYLLSNLAGIAVATLWNYLVNFWWTWK